MDIFSSEKKKGHYDVLHLLADSLKTQTLYDEEMKRVDKKGQTPIDYALTGEHKNDTLKKYLTYAACTQVEMLTVSEMRSKWRREFFLAVALTIWIPYVLYNWRVIVLGAFDASFLKGLKNWFSLFSSFLLICLLERSIFPLCSPFASLRVALACDSQVETPRLEEGRSVDFWKCGWNCRVHFCQLFLAHYADNVLASSIVARLLFLVCCVFSSAFVDYASHSPSV